MESETRKDWVYPPFEGKIEDGYVWGRGTLDIKIHLISAMEAVERLLEEGFIPPRDIYLAFGHDEEIDGMQGAYIVPYLVMACTDARKYEPVCHHIFRFTPYMIAMEDNGRIHGTNERISVENVNRCVDFFMELFRADLSI